MSASWTTKWGARRVRHDPPSLAEALAAARDLSDDVGAQAEIAAGLMGVPVAEAKAELSRLAVRRPAATLLAASRDKGGLRTVVVERKTSRRVPLPSPAARAPARPR